MSVNLSIKDVPDDLADRLRQRAQRNHRSLQGELRAIIEAAASDLPRRRSVLEVFEHLASLGPGTPGDSVEIVRHMRDTRNDDHNR